MDGLQLLCFKSSKSSRLLSNATEIPRARWDQSWRKASMFFNYGYRGEVLNAFYTRFPTARNVPVINGNRIPNKRTALRLAQDIDVPVPPNEGEGRWLQKPYYSKGGKGITFYTPGDPIPATHYPQKFIENRKYEIRVSGFLWLNPAEWGVWKRVNRENPEQIAWNHEQGGTFITVSKPSKFRVFRECIEYTSKILKEFGLTMGAADFLVDSDHSIYFIEVNTRPGFTEEGGAPTYYSAFSALKGLSINDAHKLIGGTYAPTQGNDG